MTSVQWDRPGLGREKGWSPVLPADHADSPALPTVWGTYPSPFLLPPPVPFFFKPTPSAMKAQSSNHWTAREFSPLPFLALRRTWLCFESCTLGVLKPAFRMEFTDTRRWLPDPSGCWGLPNSLAPVNPQSTSPHPSKTVTPPAGFV